jgi:hypothetical protein
VDALGLEAVGENVGSGLDLGETVPESVELEEAEVLGRSWLGRGGAETLSVKLRDGKPEGEELWEGEPEAEAEITVKLGVSDPEADVQKEREPEAVPVGCWLGLGCSEAVALRDALLASGEPENDNVTLKEREPVAVPEGCWLGLGNNEAVALRDGSLATGEPETDKEPLGDCDTLGDSVPEAVVQKEREPDAVPEGCWLELESTEAVALREGMLASGEPEIDKVTLGDSDPEADVLWEGEPESVPLVSELWLESNEAVALRGGSLRVGEPVIDKVWEGEPETESETVRLWVKAPVGRVALGDVLWEEDPETVPLLSELGLGSNEAEIDNVTLSDPEAVAV